MRIGVAAVLAVLVGLAFPDGAAGQDPLAAARAQLATALFYASDLAQRGSLEATRLHLRQVVNCLEGPEGQHYAPAAGNPCQRQGRGVFTDLQAVAHPRAGTALRYAQAANGFALQGVAATDLEVAQSYARITAFDLFNAIEALP